MALVKTCSMAIEMAKSVPTMAWSVVLGSSEDLLDGYRDGKVGINNCLEIAIMTA